MAAQAAPAEDKTVEMCKLAAKAASAMKEGREDEAFEAVEHLIAEDGRSALWLAMRSRLRLQRGEHEAALADASRALELQAGHPEALVLRARCLAAGGGGEPAVRAAAQEALASPQLTRALREEVEAVLAALPAEPGASAGAGSDDRAAGSASQRLVSTEEVCRVASEGMQAWKDGKVAEAQGIFTILCKLDRDSNLWPRLLARAQLQEGRAAEALDAAEAALARAPRHTELLLVRGLARLRLGRREPARTDLAAARSAGGLSPAATRELREALAELGEDTTPATLPPPASPPPPAPPQAPPEGPFSPPARAAAAASSAEGAGGATSGDSSPLARASVAELLAATEVLNAKVAKVVKAALAAEAEELFHQARRHCQEALALNPLCPEAVLCLARMELANGCGASAARLIKEKHPAVLKLKGHSIEALCILAGAWEEAGDWDRAASDLERAGKMAQQAPGTTKPPLEQILGRLARAQWRGGDRDSAAALAQRVLESAQTQREACEVACAVLLHRGDYATALAVMLRCLIGHRNEPSKASADLVCGVMRRCSVEELTHVLAPREDSLDAEQRSSIAEVIAYIGLIMKECSEVVEACRLYRVSVLWAPVHGSLCLNLMHTYGLRRDELRALAWGIRYFSKLPAAVPAAKLICSWVTGNGDTDGARAAPLAPEQFSSGGANAFYDAVAIGFVILKMLFLANPHQPLPLGAAPPSGADRPPARPPWRRRLLDVDIEREQVGTQVETLIDERWHKPEEPGVEVVAGARAAAEAEAHGRVLQGLGTLLAGSREGRDLHLTQVRNEHAYFSCIYDILNLPPQPLPEPPSGPPGRLFAVGDSHVLPVAWRCVDLPAAEGQSSRHVIVPCLVTGAKLWHLQAKSTFYTKYIFWEQISAIPPGAPVVLLLGEIDCREGVLRAVQKGRHATIEAALTAVVELYVTLLLEVRRRLRRSLIFVHPVANVLPETRFLTLAFNRLLAAPATREAFTKAEIRLLNFESVLEGGDPPVDMAPLELARLELRPELRLDGTHMSPSYVDSHLGPALRRAWPAA